MRGPWDRQDHFRPFATDQARPPGAGFYPEDLTADAFKAYVAAHPEQKDALQGLTTVVVRDGDKLEAVPYGQAYAEWLKPAAALLVEAAGLTQNKSLRTFLTSRAAAFGSDEYRQSDKDWMDLDARVEPTIGPYETYEDDLLGLKASFEAFVTVSDPAASAKLAHYKKLLPDMESNLPIPAGRPRQARRRQPDPRGRPGLHQRRRAQERADHRVQPAQRRGGPQGKGRQEGAAAKPHRDQVRSHHEAPGRSGSSTPRRRRCCRPRRSSTRRCSTSCRTAWGPRS